MKKILMSVACLFPFALFAITSYDAHPVFLNGKPFSTAVTISGTLAIPLEDLSRGAGSNVSLEPAFQLRGNSLNAQMGWDVKKNQKTVAYKEQGKVAVSDIHITAGVNKASPLMFRVNRSGPISTNVLTLNGKAFVPLSDVAKAFGGVWTQPTGGLARGQAIQLNFASNPNAILIGL
jgi:hypothetical protein